MCGRFTVNYTYQQMLEYLNKEYSIFDMENDMVLPRYNVAPGQQVMAVINEGESYKLTTFKWGFIPSFNKNPNKGYQMINARSEDIEHKMAFKDSFYNKRCVIISDGFYEWDTKSSTNPPYYISFKDNKMKAYAGIWNKSIVSGEEVYTCAILTTKANSLVGDIHDRMPVILSNEEALKWLNTRKISTSDLKKLLNQYDSVKMYKHEVNRRVNNVKNDDSKCIEEYKELRLF